MIVQQPIDVATRGRGVHEITADVARVVASAGLRRGLCNVFITHTSASLLVCENADPQVMRDLETFMSRLVPDGDPDFAHDAEGPDDMPAHVRSVLTQVEVTVPIVDGACALGTWQGIYLWEHRARAHRRRVLVTVYGE
ncbi:MAG: secondary thiamine-phosphate synthase enzyme YjbQ [Gammaproteobacteria bacterium]